MIIVLATLLLAPSVMSTIGMKIYEKDHLNQNDVLSSPNQLDNCQNPSHVCHDQSIVEFTGDYQLDFSFFTFDLPGRSDPFFTMKKICDFGQTAYGLSSADFNNDGLLDFAVSWATNPWTKSGINIFYNQGNQEFLNETVYYIPGPDIEYIEDLDAADYDNDGDFDLIFSLSENINHISSNGTIYLLRNQGDNSFGEKEFITRHCPEPGRPKSKRTNPQMTSADFDGDGDIDFLVGDNSGLVEFYKNNGHGIFVSETKCDFVEGSLGLAAADFDNDNDIDFIVTSFNRSKYSKGGTVYLVENDGTSTCFHQNNSKKIAVYPANESYFASLGAYQHMSLCALDYNDDGLMDFMGGGAANLVLFIQQDGKQLYEPFTAGRLLAPNAKEQTWYVDDLRFGGLTAGDFDGDGCDDVVVGGVQGVVRLFTNTGSLIDIVQPDRASVYVDNEIWVWTIPLYSFLKDGTSLVFGDLTVRTQELEPLSKVEFYLDDKLVFTDEETPFEWEWNRFSFGRHTVKAQAYDLKGNPGGFDTARVWKFL